MHLCQDDELCVCDIANIVVLRFANASGITCERSTSKGVSFEKRKTAFIH